MDSVSVNQFRGNLKTYAEQVNNQHMPIKVTRRGGGDFVVMAADDWEREQETLYVLQNQNLVQQIAESLQSYNGKQNTSHEATADVIDEILK